MSEAITTNPEQRKIEILLLQIGFLNRELEYAIIKIGSYGNESISYNDEMLRASVEYGEYLEAQEEREDVEDPEEGEYQEEQNKKIVIPSFAWFIKDRYGRYNYFKDHGDAPEKALEQIGKLANVFAFNVLFIYRKIHPDTDPTTALEEVLQLIYDKFLEKYNGDEINESKDHTSPFAKEIKKVPKKYINGDLQVALDYAIAGCVKTLQIWAGFYEKEIKTNPDLSICG